MNPHNFITNIYADNLVMNSPVFPSKDDIYCTSCTSFFCDQTLIIGKQRYCHRFERMDSFDWATLTKTWHKLFEMWDFHTVNEKKKWFLRLMYF